MRLNFCIVAAAAVCTLASAAFAQFADNCGSVQTGEIETKLDDTREELYKLRFQIATGSLTDTSRMKVLKHDIARLLTIIRERT